jgi:hypothetical protein
VAKIIAFDLDGTLTVGSATDHEDRTGTYAFRRPDFGMRDRMRRSYESGWTVVIFTGRPEGDRPLTENWLYANNFLYHYLFMGKIYYSYLIDDRARTSADIDAILDQEEESKRHG